MRRLTYGLLFFISSSAFAQQQPDPAFLQRALAEVQAQRNQANDALAVVSARAAGMAEDLAKANAKIQEMQAKASKPDDVKP